MSDARPVGPGRAAWLGAPVAQPQCPTCAAAEAWAARAQRQLDEERRRGAALVAAVRAVVDAPADGCNDAGVRAVLTAALAAYEGSAEA